jgi:hypothetical protein
MIQIGGIWCPLHRSKIGKMRNWKCYNLLFFMRLSWSFSTR